MLYIYILDQVRITVDIYYHRNSPATDVGLEDPLSVSIYHLGVKNDRRSVFTFAQRQFEAKANRAKNI